MMKQTTVPIWDALLLTLGQDDWILWKFGHHWLEDWILCLCINLLELFQDAFAWALELKQLLIEQKAMQNLRKYQPSRHYTSHLGKSICSRRNCRASLHGNFTGSFRGCIKIPHVAGFRPSTIYSEFIEEKMWYGHVWPLSPRLQGTRWFNSMTGRLRFDYFLCKFSRWNPSTSIYLFCPARLLPLLRTGLPSRESISGTPLQATRAVCVSFLKHVSGWV